MAVDIGASSLEVGLVCIVYRGVSVTVEFAHEVDGDTIDSLLVFLGLGVDDQPDSASLT